ncbi:MAG: nucleotidyltransferase domain-containing protein [Candidatus Pacearchaeota archaeon]
MEFLKKILNEISLSSKEERKIFHETKKMIKLLKNFINKKIIVGGSLAKGTLIKKDKQDIDIFVIFDSEEDTKNLEIFLKKANIKFDIFHGSRDYFRIEKDNIIFEIVPLVKIKDKAEIKNPMDLSSLHVSYIKKKINDKPSLADQIKLAKAFCKAQGIYGAESYIKGFSGYAIEVLICYYGSFLNFLKKIQKERFIDIEKYFKSEREAKRELNEQKICSPLILIDPVYKYRNLCAGLSYESYLILKEKAKEFLKKPSVYFFREKKFDEKEFLNNAKKKRAFVLILNLYSFKEKEDVSAIKMKKFFDFLKKEIEKKQQKVVNSFFIFLGGKKSKAYFSLILKEKIKVYGPRKNMKKAIENFLNKRKEIFFDNKRVFSYENFDIYNFLEKQRKVAFSMGVSFEQVRPGEDSNL